MTALAHPITPGAQLPSIVVEGDTTLIRDLEVSDPDLAGLLQGSDPDEHAELVRRVLTVGARGLAVMGVGIDVASIDARVRRTLGSLTDEAEQRLRSVIEQGRAAMSEHLDPERRSSTISRALEEFASWRDGFLGRIDPASEGSHTTAFLEKLAAIVGPDGDLEGRITAALDPASDESALGMLRTSIEERFTELRDAVLHRRGYEEGAADEATRGTAQGSEYEDVVEGLLRSWAASPGGCVVERTSRQPGAMGPQSMVGDFVIELAEGPRIAVEAKNQAVVGLGGKDGILAELDRALANRQAEAAVCISAREAFPAEVGRFGIYGNRILAVDDGDGVLASAALQLARVTAIAAGRGMRFDPEQLAQRVGEIRRLAEQLRGMRSALTDVRKGVESVHERLGDLRRQLIDQVSGIEGELEKRENRQHRP